MPINDSILRTPTIVLSLRLGGNVVILNLLEYSDFVHQLFSAASLNRFDSHIFDTLLFSPFVDNGVLSTADFFINVIIVHLLIFYIVFIND